MKMLAPPLHTVHSSSLLARRDQMRSLSHVQAVCCAPGGAPRRRHDPLSAATPRAVSVRRALTLRASFGLRRLTNTAIHPVKQVGKALFAGKGTNTKLFAAFTATECAVPAGCPVPAGTLYVGTS